MQSGIGRTGKFFAIEHYGVEPDLIVTAKSLGGGLPIAAVTGRAEIMDAPEHGRAGRHLRQAIRRRCAAALAAIEMMESGELLHRSTAIGKIFEARARVAEKMAARRRNSRGIGWNVRHRAGA